MKQEDKNNAIQILDLAKIRLDKAGWEFSATWEGFSMSAHSYSGGSWRPDPLAAKLDKINRERPSQLELNAWHQVRKLESVEFDCAFVWHCVKDKINPRTQQRYRVGDLLALLTVKYYSSFSVVHGSRFIRDIWSTVNLISLEKLSSNYFKVFPKPVEKEQKKSA